MPAQVIAQSLAYINWTLLVALALGSFGAAALGRLFSAATRGYLAFVTFCAAALGLLAWFADGALPPAAGMTIATTAALDGPRRLALLLFALIAAADLVALLRGRRAALLGAAGVAAGVAALALAAVGWTVDPIAAVPAFVQLVVLAAVTGGGLALMVLGHWYLVTPHLSEGPLVAGGRMLTGLLGVQLALFIAWVATGTGGGGPFGALVGPSAVFVWLRLLVGLLFPLATTAMATRTARTRSMESATGLLYIGMAAIAAGTIDAAGLFFGAGLLV